MQFMCTEILGTQRPNTFDTWRLSNH